MNTNAKYRSSIFSLLFNDPVILRELYCALKGVSLPDDVPITINTLSDVLYMDRINDISFEIGGRLVVLIEHQSTINPNMALRLLLYMSKVYEKIIHDKKIYSLKKITIPRPEFFVLYNGKDQYPDKNEIRLTDLFESSLPIGLRETGIPALELIVKVININEGKNEAIAQKCKTLAEYNSFVAKAREYLNDGYNLDESIKRTVFFCRDHDILVEFLEKNATEVLNMLMTEWNWDEALNVRYEEGLEDGIEKSKADIAIKMKKAGCSNAEIEKFTGLPSKTIMDIECGQSSSIISSL